eukprot:390864_1
MPSPINIQELVGYETRSIESFSNATNPRKPSLCRAQTYTYGILSPFEFSTEPISFKPTISRALSQPQSSVVFDQIDEEEEMESETSTMLRANVVSFTKSMDDQLSIDIESTPIVREHSIEYLEPVKDNRNECPFLVATQLSIDVSID